MSHSLNEFIYCFIKAIRTYNSEARKSEIINDIVNGVIREINYNDHITIDEYDKYKKSIDNAFKYRTDKIKGGKRDMECVYITGKSGTGKSTYAKIMCEDKNYSYFVSSGSNDVLDGYAGQDCIILDDLRPSCMGLSDLQKVITFLSVSLYGKIGFTSARLSSAFAGHCDPRRAPLYHRNNFLRYNKIDIVSISS